MAVIRIPVFIIASIFALLASAPFSCAQDLLFPANQFGNANLRPNQSLGGNDSYIQSQKNGVFEPLSEFNEGDIFRKQSRPVGRLSMLVRGKDGSEGVATCTATLVSDDRLLTNYHCIPGFEGTVLKAIIHLGYLRQDQDAVDSYPVDIDPLNADAGLDFSLLHVEGNPGQKYGHVEVVPARVEPNSSLVIFHHPAGLPLRLTRFRCKAYPGAAYNGHVFRHRCDTLGGSSGSLVFDNSHRVVALHHSGGLTGDSQSSFNAGTSIQAILEHLGRGLAAPNTAIPSPPAATPAPADPVQDHFIASIPERISQNRLNVRSGPGTSHGIIGSIPAGTKGVVVFDGTCRKSDDGLTKKPWCRIRWQGLDGWASSSGLRR